MQLLCSHSPGKHKAALSKVPTQKVVRYHMPDYKKKQLSHLLLALKRAQGLYIQAGQPQFVAGLLSPTEREGASW